MTVTSVPARVYAVEEIDAALYALENICRRSNAHQIRRFVFRQVRNHFVKNMIHLLMAFSYCQSADRITVEIHLGNPFCMVNADILINRTLVDSEQKLMFVDRVFPLVQLLLPLQHGIFPLGSPQGLQVLHGHSLVRRLGLPHLLVVVQSRHQAVHVPGVHAVLLPQHLQQRLGLGQPFLVGLGPPHPRLDGLLDSRVVVRLVLALDQLIEGRLLRCRLLAIGFRFRLLAPLAPGVGARCARSVPACAAVGKQLQAEIDHCFQ